MCVREKYSLTQSWSNCDLICHDFSSILKETSGSHYGLLGWGQSSSCEIITPTWCDRF